MKKPNNRHDKAFKSLVREKIFAQAFIEQYFSKEELSLIDVHSMELWNASFLGTADTEYHSDVVYKVEAIKARAILSSFSSTSRSLKN